MRYLLLALTLLLAACSPNKTCVELNNCPTADAGKPDTGPTEAFEIKVLDPNAPGGFPAQLSLAVSGDTIGVTYFVESVGADGGVIRELRYVENAASPKPEVVAKVVQTYGTSLAYDSNGKPYVGYLGQPGNLGTYWYEGSPNVATRSGATWTSQAVYTLADNVIGLWPAVAIDQSNNTVYTASRNIHNTQFAVQGAEKADIDFVEGVNGAGWTQSTAVRGFCPTPPAGCVDQTEGHGGYNQMVVPADGRPFVVWGALGATSFEAAGIYSVRRNADKTWPANNVKIKMTANMGAGPSLAYKSGSGFLISYYETNQIKLLESLDGTDWNKAPSVVVGGGTLHTANATAWTDDGLPAVTYYLCSERSGVVQPCPKAEDELMLTWRVQDDVWQSLKVDHEGGHYMKLAFWQNRAVIAYKDVDDKQLKLAIQH